jgi:hypothetical protein
MKTEVYSWRLTGEMKVQLEDQARKEGKSMSALLEDIASEALRERRNGQSADESAHEALRERVMATVGTIHGGDPDRAERAGELVREIIYHKHLKESNAVARRSARRRSN